MKMADLAKTLEFQLLDQFDSHISSKLRREFIGGKLIGCEFRPHPRQPTIVVFRRIYLSFRGQSISQAVDQLLAPPRTTVVPRIDKSGSRK